MSLKTVHRIFQEELNSGLLSLMVCINHWYIAVELDYMGEVPNNQDKGGNTDESLITSSSSWNDRALFVE